MKKRLFPWGLSVLLTILTIFLVSCISTSSKTIRYGNDLAKPSKLIVVGKTGEDEIKKTLGAPSKREMLDQGYRLTYETIWKKESAVYGIQAEEKIIKTQTLEITIDSQGIVIDKKFKEVSPDN